VKRVRQLGADVGRAVWEPDIDTLPRWRAWLLRLLRIAYAVARDLGEGQLTLRAMSLVYTTLLSLVPLIAAVSSRTSAPACSARSGCCSCCSPWCR
jgi:membrane protein